MSTFYTFACVPLIAALGYIGVSGAVAGAGLCVFASITLVLLCSSPAPMRDRPDAVQFHFISSMRAVIAVRTSLRAWLGPTPLCRWPVVLCAAARAAGR